MDEMDAMDEMDGGTGIASRYVNSRPFGCAQGDGFCGRMTGVRGDGRCAMWGARLRRVKYSGHAFGVLFFMGVDAWAWGAVGVRRLANDGGRKLKVSRGAVNMVC